MISTRPPRCTLSREKAIKKCIAVPSDNKKKHVRNTGIAGNEQKRRNVSTTARPCNQTRTLFPSLKRKRKRVRETERKPTKGHVPIPMTVPYSDFLSSAETGGQRRMSARKRKKANERPERRRVVCVLVGGDMLS